MSDILVFISHCSADKSIASNITKLLRAAFSIPPDRIRCTSVEGHKLPIGAKHEEQLKKEIIEASVVIGLITEISFDSVWVLFELGARWGHNGNLLPLVARGVSPIGLKGPIHSLNALSCDDRTDVQQLISDLSRYFSKQPNSPSSYEGELTALVESSKVEANELTHSGSTDIAVLTTPVQDSIPSTDRLYFLYFDVIRFAKHVHHLFQKLDQEGCHKIDTAARTLFLTQSEGSQPGLIKDCQDGWGDCRDSRDEIKITLIDVFEHLVERVDKAYKELRDNTRRDLATFMIKNSLNSFNKIKASLETYKTQIPIVSKHFSSDGILNINTLKDFEQEIMVFTRTVGELLSYADLMMKNTLEALEVDSRLGVEKEYE